MPQNTMSADGAQALALFINSPVWAETKRVLAGRKPASPAVGDDALTTAQKSFRRVGWEDAFDEIESAPRLVEENDNNANEPSSAFPDVVDTEKD